MHNRFFLFVIFTCTFFCLLKTNGQALSQEDSSYQALDSILIQNPRLQIPFAEQNRDIQVINRQQIQRMPVQSLDELLAHIGGIDVRRRGAMGAQTDISINGGTFDQTLVLLNGLKVIDPQTGHNMMMLPVNVESIERIEVLKGPAAAAYGVNAINGAINIVTYQPSKTGIMAHALTGSSLKKDSLSNHLYAGLDVGAAASLNAKNSLHFLSVNGTQSNGHRYNTSVKNRKLFYSNRIRLNENSLEVLAGYTNHEFGANGFYAAPVDVDSKEQVQTTIAGVKGKIRVNDWWVLRPSVSYRYSDDHYLLNKHKPEIYENKHYTNSIDLELNNTFSSAVGAFGWGLEYRRNRIVSNSLGNHHSNDIGIFGNYSFDRVKDLLVNVGLYANYNDEYSWDWMPSLDLGYRLHPHWRVFANIGTGMRQPTYTDLYYAGPVNIGNPNLSPEKSWQTEAGIKYHTNLFRGTLTYFYRDTDQFIDWVKTELDDPWKTLNYQHVKMNGLSLEADYQVFPPDQYRDFNFFIHGSYTYLNPKIAVRDQQFRYSNYALENLKHQVIGSLRFEFFNRFTLSLTQRYEKRMNYKDYVLLAARLSVNFKDFQVFVDGDNLSNVEFIEAGAAPMVGSWLSLGIKWQGFR